MVKSLFFSRKKLTTEGTTELEFYIYNFLCVLYVFPASSVV